MDDYTYCNYNSLNIDKLSFAYSNACGLFFSYNLVNNKSTILEILGSHHIV